MKKAIVLAILALCLIGLMGSTVMAEDGPGPAPNSGDGFPDGSGWDYVNPWGDETPGTGPSLCAGDGIPDGSCFESLLWLLGLF